MADGFWPNKCQSQRGQLSGKSRTLTLTSTTPVRALTFDTAEQGAQSVSFHIKAPSTTCNMKYQVSPDGVVWTTIACQDEGGSAVSTSGKDVTATNYGHIILNYSINDNYMGWRFHALLLTNADTTPNAVEAHGCAK